MSCYLGNDGKIEADGVVVGGVRSFSVEESVEVLDCTAMGDPARVTRPGQKKWSGSMTAMLDAADAGQQKFAIGAVVTLTLYPTGDAAGRQKLTGEAMITSIRRSAELDQVVEIEASFESAGELVITQVA